MKKIGITTTVPIEVLIAAGYQPVDLNNIFVTDENYDEYIEIAERDGFPKSICAWIKGLYGVCLLNGIKEIVGVVEGDCSNTRALVEILGLRGIKVHRFSYPSSHSREDVKKEIVKFMEIFGVSMDQVENVRQRLNGIRKKAMEIDRLTYEENKASGFENHLYQICMSDCNGSPEDFDRELTEAIVEIKGRQPVEKNIRLGYIGVPPMTADIYEFVEGFKARFVYNEVQREFTFPRHAAAGDIFEQYYDYTYPYDNDYRIGELEKQIELRQLDAIIHYTQAFCHRAIEDIYLKTRLDIPVLNIEGDRKNELDARTKLRLEAFLDMIQDVKENINESIGN